MTHKKRSAGGCETTTADTNYSTTIIAVCTRCKAAGVRLAALLAAFLRGLA
jgi:hypothetical protein